MGIPDILIYAEDWVEGTRRRRNDAGGWTRYHCCGVNQEGRERIWESPRLRWSVPSITFEMQILDKVEAVLLHSIVVMFPGQNTRVYLDKVRVFRFRTCVACRHPWLLPLYYGPTPLCYDPCQPSLSGCLVPFCGQANTETPLHRHTPHTSLLSTATRNPKHTLKLMPAARSHLIFKSAARIQSFSS